MSIDYRLVRAHNRGECWPAACPCCEYEDEQNEPDWATGMCLSCGAVEVALVERTGTRDLSGIGEHHAYPTGYGCELCS